MQCDCVTTNYMTVLLSTARSARHHSELEDIVVQVRYVHSPFLEDQRAHRAHRARVGKLCSCCFC